jgi:hypothetical protein
MCQRWHTWRTRCASSAPQRTPMIHPLRAPSSRTGEDFSPCAALEHALLRGSSTPPEGERAMHSSSITSLALAALLVSSIAPPARAGCGCDKPAPPRAAIRPFVAAASQTVTLFDSTLEDGATYDVAFAPATGATQWAQGRAVRRKDVADGVPREHLRVTLPDLPLGPCAVSVWRDGARRFGVARDDFTVAAHPIALHETGQTTRRDYRAAVGADGTVYIPVDVTDVSDATRFSGTALGLGLQYEANNVAMYNDQGYLMQLLDATSPRLFELQGGGLDRSTTLSYWRHEFRTYAEGEQAAAHALADDAGEWHADGTRHVDHDHLVVALRGSFADGTMPTPGATPPFQLVIDAQPEAH